MSLFALLDCNNFYASCERAFNPSLENKPVVVLSNNDGCIIARSNEAKKLGIPMGAPFFKWEKLCRMQKVKVFSSNYELYGDMSRRVMTLLKEYCPTVEIYSIDEAFLLLNNFTQAHALEFAKKLKQMVHAHTGLPVSIGIGPTKTLAKIANYIAKTELDSGVYLLTNSETLTNYPVEKIWGIGRNLAIKLKQLNIYTADELYRADASLLRSKFSVTVEKIVYELRGKSCLSLEAIQSRKQIISSRSFRKAVTSLTEIEEALSHYTAIACTKLRKQKSVASAVAVFLHTNFFRKNEPQYENSNYFPFPIPTADTGYIIRTVKKCAKYLFKKEYRYHKAGIILLDILPASLRQLDLLSEHPERKDALMKTVDYINTTFGKDTIFHCAEGIKREWQIKSEHRSPRYTTQWDELLKVK